MSPSRRRRGHLLISDLSGYTAFLTGNELEHAQQIVEELVRVQLEQVGPPARLVKLEGDAIFWELPEGIGAERVLELGEQIYSAFAEHLFDVQRSTTCRCTACAALPTLDLKLFAHFGEYVVQRLGGLEDLAGPDVILIHRLMKNGIAERLGLRGYLFATRACLDQAPRHRAFTPHGESYEHLGAVEGGVLDLHAAHAERTQRQQTHIGPNGAHLQLALPIRAPAALVWDLLFDPVKRATWETTFDVSARPNEDGVVDVGATLHCAHGGSEQVLHFVDWRPFRYATFDVRSTGPGTPPPCRITQELIPVEGGVRLEQRIRLDAAPLPVRWVARLLPGVVRRQIAKQLAPLVVAAERHARMLEAATATPAADAEDERLSPRAADA